MKGRKILNQDESNNNIINIDKNMGVQTSRSAIQTLNF
jgi:hypothetical protein